MQILNPTFWFHIRPPVMSLPTAGILALGFVILLIIGVICLRRASQNENRHRGRGEQKLGGWFITWAVIGLVWVFMAYERINFFGAWFWTLVMIVLAFLWLALIMRYWKKVVPSMETLRRERAEFEKYLPKKKR
jgi:cell division protein FtsW (lipid II flippase)